MKTIKSLAMLITMTLPLIGGCASSDKIKEQQVSKETHATVHEETPFEYEAPRDRHLQSTLYGMLGRGMRGQLLLYDTGKREVRLETSEGRLNATDFNNDGHYDLIENKGISKRYENDSFLNQAANYILEQNR